MPKYLHIALNFQSDFPNLIDLRAIFSQMQGAPAQGSERQENPCYMLLQLQLSVLLQLQLAVALIYVVAVVNIGTVAAFSVAAVIAFSVAAVKVINVAELQL